MKKVTSTQDDFYRFFTQQKKMCEFQSHTEIAQLINNFMFLGGPVVTFFLVKNIVLPVITQWDVDEVKTNVTSAIAAGLYYIYQLSLS